MNGLADSPIHIEAIPMGDDWLFRVVGGEAHIGAAATAFYEKEEARVMISQVPGHREGQLAAELSRLACGRLKRTVTVVMGIHVEQPTREDIADIVRQTRHLMQSKLDQLTLQ